MRLWLIVLFVLVPVSMIVSGVRAEDVPKEPNKFELPAEFQISKELTERYFVGKNYNLDLISTGEAAINRKRCVGIISFAERWEVEHFLNHKILKVNVKAMQIFCLCGGEHNGTRLKVINIKNDKNEWIQVYNKNPHIKEKRQEPPPLLPHNIA